MAPAQSIVGGSCLCMRGLERPDGVVLYGAFGSVARSSYGLSVAYLRVACDRSPVLYGSWCAMMCWVGSFVDRCVSSCRSCKYRGAR